MSDEKVMQLISLLQEASELLVDEGARDQAVALLETLQVCYPELCAVGNGPIFDLNFTVRTDFDLSQFD